MTARSACPNCNRIYQLDENLRGKKVRCKSCQELFVVAFAAKDEADDDNSATQPRRKVRTRPTSKDSSTRRYVIWAVTAVAVVGVIGLFWVFVGKRLFSSELTQVVAELDRREPGWRLDEMEANRRQLPADQNSATAILAAGRAMNKDAWSTDLEEMIKNQGRTAQFDAQQAATLQSTVHQLQPAITEARKVADMPHGRYTIDYARDGVSTPLPHLQQARHVYNLLMLDAATRGQEGDIDGAMTSCRAMLNVGRSVDDEPLSISQLVRIACQVVAIRSLERALAQGEPSEASLAATQRILEDEAAQPVFLAMIRGERGSMHLAMAALTESNGADLLKKLGSDQPVPSAADVRKSHAWLLRYLTRLGDAAQLPAHEQLKQIEQCEATLSEAPALAKQLAVGSSRLATACQRRQARLSCAAAAIALERYRRANGRWPDSLKRSCLHN